jgi:hypothetical protein
VEEVKVNSTLPKPSFLVPFLDPGSQHLASVLGSMTCKFFKNLYTEVSWVFEGEGIVI